MKIKKHVALVAPEMAGIRFYIKHIKNKNK